MKVPVNGCDATGCAYCLHKHCHAVDVEVAGENGECDSFTRSVMFNVTPHFSSQVTVCQSTDCAHNRNAGCLLASVEFSASGTKAVCREYSQRKGLSLAG